MKVTFTATVDLGDDFCDEFSQDEINWTMICVNRAISIRLYDVDDDYPVKVNNINYIETVSK